MDAPHPVETWTLRTGNLMQVRSDKGLRPGPYIYGPVWCPQTDMHTFVARRNGTVFVTGNSYSGTSVLAGVKVGQE